MRHILQKIIQNHKKEGDGGIYSVCSANRFVLQAAMLQAKEDGSSLLLEATSNQVDQFGGYTGMTPEDFRLYVLELARDMAFSPQQLLLGGDHLGPNVWQNQPEEKAMKQARRQIDAYVRAGFSKIHLDASMPLKGDDTRRHLPLNASVVARRTAELCAVAEQAAAQGAPDAPRPVYIIGTDVPVPGGAQESLEHIRITPVAEVQEILELTQKAFMERNLQDAWQRVLAVVVQPGVEFGDQQIAEYRRDRARELSKYIETRENFVYEAHSTDYQTQTALSEMVEDHFVILKVGPALTFAFREAVFALAYIEQELLPLHRGWKDSRIIETLEQAMRAQPQYWQKHYHGTQAQQAFARRYSLSDRMRYYWMQTEVATALNQLINNLQQTTIPFTLISQFLPEQVSSLRNRQWEAHPRSLIHHKIRQAIGPYVRATESKNAVQTVRDSSDMAMEIV